MEILKFFEARRTPFWDWFFLQATKLGEENVILIVGIVTVWCVSKRWGFYILFSSVLTQTLNQTLKSAFRIPRPWIADQSFRPVPAAMYYAQGYSFPSGHTQCATALFGSVGYINRHKKIIALLSWLLVFLVGLSRIYLGVHYPADVVFALTTGILFLLLLYRPFLEYGEDASGFRLFRLLCVLLPAGFLALTAARLWGKAAPQDMEYHTLVNAVKLFSASLAFSVSWFLDCRYIRYSPRAPLPAQVLKVVLGLALILWIRESVGGPLYRLFGNEVAAYAVTYFLLVFFAGTIWPLTFKFWEKATIRLFKK